MFTFGRKGAQKKCKSGSHTAVSEHAAPAIRNLERKDAQQIVGKVGDRWANTGVQGATEQYDKDAREYRHAQGTASEKRLSGLESAFALYILSLVNGDTAKLLDHYRQAGVRVQRSSHPLLTILRAGFAPNRDTASRWAKVLQLALAAHTDPKDLGDFIKQQDGIRRCALRFEKMQRKLKGALNEQPTSRRGSSQGSIDAKRRSRPEIRLTKSFRREYPWTDSEDGVVSVRLRGSASGGVLTLTRIRVAKTPNKSSWVRFGKKRTW